MKCVLAALLALLTAVPALAQGGPPREAMPAAMRAAETPSTLAERDGKVTGLNQKTYDLIGAIRRRNPSTLSEADAAALLAGARADGKLDPAETDLLRELTNPAFRAISIYRAGAGPKELALTAYPVIGAARQLLSDVVDPPRDLAPLWNRGEAGWHELIAEARRGRQQDDQVVGFVAARIGAQAKASPPGSAFKPVRDLLMLLSKWSRSASGADAALGKSIAYRAAAAADKADQDKLPDFLYSWMKPA